jgi:hypothetical protein
MVATSDVLALNRVGWLTSVTLVISSIPTYNSPSYPFAAWARKQIDKIRYSFLWKGYDKASGGYCPVNWLTICQPKDI